MFARIRARRKLGELIRCWVAYRDLVLRHWDLAEVRPEKEQEFLASKARIARLLPAVVAGVPSTARPDAQRQGGEIVRLMNSRTKLLNTTPRPPQEREAFHTLWHEKYLFLNQLQGLPWRPDRPVRAASPGPVPSGLPMKRAYRPLRVGHLLRSVVQLGVLVLILYLIGRAFGLRWSRVEGFAAERPADLGAVGHNLWTALGSLGVWMQSTLEPVRRTYGTEATIALVGVLLIALGYWAFIRSR